MSEPLGMFQAAQEIKKSLNTLCNSYLPSTLAFSIDSKLLLDQMNNLPSSAKPELAVDELSPWTIIAKEDDFIVWFECSVRWISS